jgi:deoxyribose-phosphate aldolase
MDRSALAACIDHTLLRPEATAAEVDALCAEAVELAVAAVCVSPSQLPLMPALGGIAVAAVVGFPSGAHQPAVKAHEAEVAVDAGATELDVVVNLGLVKAGEWRAVGHDLGAVRAAAPTVVLKVIVESALLTDDELGQACLVAEAAGADFVKTSTGFHPAGGATVAAVSRMRAVVGDRLGVKASGGIRDAATALAMLEAGASRLGCSATRAILDGLRGPVG